jgi:D-glycero-beta-D-manno-heptose 1-phosphate adenylyltransferase
MSKYQHLLDKINQLEQLKPKIEALKKQGKSIVFTNGCFDIIHKGHIDYLTKASDLGDVLIVAVNTDESVKKLGKSASRPIQDENARLFVLAGLFCVDFVLLFNEDTPLNVIKSLLPDVLVKGADYLPENIVGYKDVIDNGGRVETIDFIEGYSTSLIEQKIKNN